MCTIDVALNYNIMIIFSPSMLYIQLLLLLRLSFHDPFYFELA
jgi:hypothetical protein